MRRIVLCADDYGQAPSISQGILNLVKLRRLSAVSCMVNCENWHEHAAWLKEYKDQIDIGLHFNLTEGCALSKAYHDAHGAQFKPLIQVLAQASLRQLNKAALEAECYAQIARFVDTLGFVPHHIDGHQHVHQFPLVRDAMMNVYRYHLREHTTYIRLVKEKIIWQDIVRSSKKVIIHLSGTNALERLLKLHDIPHNKSFAGIYDFAKHASQYRQLFRTFLQQMNDGGLMMCHPGLANANGDDVIADARGKEYAYFSSDEFLQDCQDAGIELTRFEVLDCRPGF